MDEHGVDTLIEQVWGVLEAWRSPALDLAAMEHTRLRLRLDELAAHPLIVGSRAARLRFLGPADPVPSSLNGLSPASPSTPVVQGRGHNQSSRMVSDLVTVATEK
jgi:hypothetical protein